MNFLKKHYKILLSVLGCLFVLYVLPSFVDLGRQKKYFENKIEEVFGFKAEIKGKVAFTILPYPTIILNRVEILSKTEDNKKNLLANASKIFVDLSLSNLFQKDLTMEKIGFIDTLFYGDSYKKSEYESIEKILSQKNFKLKQIYIKNSRFVAKQDFIHNINFKFIPQKDGKINGVGSLIFKNGYVKDISMDLFYSNKENYNLVLKFIYALERSKIKNDITFVVKDGEKILSGKTDLLTDNISHFINVFDKNLILPKTPAFNEKLNLRASFQNSADTILVNDGYLEGTNLIGSFKGKLPFKNGNLFDIDWERMTLNIDFSNVSLDRIFTTKKDIVRNCQKLFNYV